MDARRAARVRCLGRASSQRASVKTGVEAELPASDEAALVQINVEGLFSPTGQTFELFSILMIPVSSWMAFLLGVLHSIFRKSTKTSSMGGGGGQGRLQTNLITGPECARTREERSRQRSIKTTEEESCSGDLKLTFSEGNRCECPSWERHGNRGREL